MIFLGGVTFFLLEMVVNLSQNWVAIGVFNNCNFMTSKKHYCFLETSNMKENFLFTTTLIAMALAFILFNFKLLLTKKYCKHSFKLTTLTFFTVCFFSDTAPGYLSA